MNIVISGGKTAGHITPALALIDKLEGKIYYAGNSRQMEYQMVKDKVDEFLDYDVIGFKRRNPILLIKATYKFFKAYKKAKIDLKRVKPDVVIGMGGFVCAPVLFAARSLKIKTIIHEQNVVFGLVNKILSKRVDKVIFSFEESLDYYKLDNAIAIGNPASERTKDYIQSDINYPKNYKRVLFLGGSLGAKRINDLALDIIKKSKDFNLFFVVITGNNYEIEEDYSNAKFIGFTENLTSIMQECDLIISRAGASTLCEVLNIPKLMIVIPSPNVTNNHQEKNAMALAKKNKLIMLNEEGLTSSVLLSEIIKIVYDDELKKDIIKNNKEANKGDVIWRFIKEIENMIS